MTWHAVTSRAELAAEQSRLIARRTHLGSPPPAPSTSSSPTQFLKNEAVKAGDFAQHEGRSPRGWTDFHSRGSAADTLDHAAQTIIHFARRLGDRESSSSPTSSSCCRRGRRAGRGFPGTRSPELSDAGREAVAQGLAARGAIHDDDEAAAPRLADVVLGVVLAADHHRGRPPQRRRRRRARGGELWLLDSGDDGSVVPEPVAPYEAREQIHGLAATLG